jgi:hypothetical protein
METWWDWRSWIREGLMDAVTMNEVPARMRAEILSECRARGVPVISRPSMHSADDATWAGRGVAMIDQARREGLQGFNIYESAAVMRLGADGALHFRAPALWDRVAAIP